MFSRVHHDRFWIFFAFSFFYFYFPALLRASHRANEKPRKREKSQLNFSCLCVFEEEKKMYARESDNRIMKDYVEKMMSCMLLSFKFVFFEPIMRVSTSWTFNRWSCYQNDSWKKNFWRRNRENFCISLLNAWL